MAEKTERRYCELRAEADGRRLEGVAIRYGDVADLGTFRETFRAGSFGDVAGADVLLNASHQRTAPLARTGGGGLSLIDTPEALSIEAALPETRAADDVLALVKSRVLRGLSIEFRAIEESMVAGVRVIARAALVAVAVVDSGAYAGSEVAARHAVEGKRRRWWQ